MASLQAIKHRRSTVENIRKITHAMELVATSKLRRARVEYEHVLAYENLLEDTFDEIFNHLSISEIKTIFKDNKNIPGTAWIVVTSDLGLAGSFNSNILKLSKSTIKKEDKIIIIGTKGMSGLAKNYRKQIVAQVPSDAKDDNAHLSSEIMKYAYNLIVDGQIGKIGLIYNKYINNLVQQENAIIVHPFDAEQRLKNKQNQQQKSNSIIEFEPSVKDVLNETMPLYLAAKVYSAFASSKLSEMASRRNAMENATNNADDLIEDLNIKYNRQRQSKITQELNEIVAGADAV